MTRSDGLGRSGGVVNTRTPLAAGADAVIRLLSSGVGETCMDLVPAAVGARVAPAGGWVAAARLVGSGMVSTE